MPGLRSLLTIGLALVAAGSAARGDATAFLLRRADAQLVIEPVVLRDGQTQVFPATPESGIIELILPPGHGGSGQMCKLAKDRVIIARLADGVVEVRQRGGDLGEKEYVAPARKLDDLHGDDIRVCVVGGDGQRRAFVICGYKSAAPDDEAPVMDMFGGKVPLRENDYLISTDTYAARVGEPLVGEVELEFDQYLFARGRLGDGPDGWFVIDTAATSTVASKAALPPGAAVEKSSMVQYSSAGKKLLPYQVGAAAGKAPTALGHAGVELRCGELRVGDLSVMVMSELPALAGREVLGIVGMDVLRRAAAASFEFAGKTARLRLRESAAAARPDEAPFSLCMGHVFVRGQANETALFWLLDTGSPRTFLDEPAAAAVHATFATGETGTIGGIGAGRVSQRPATVRRLRIGGVELAKAGLHVAGLSVFESYRGPQQYVGLIGNDVLAPRGGLEIDFVRRVVRLDK